MDGQMKTDVIMVVVFNEVPDLSYCDVGKGREKRVFLSI